MNFKEFKQLVKRADKTHIIERVYHSLLNFKNRREFKDRLKINLRGVKRNKKVYIVRRAADNVGLFSYFETSLGGIAYADKNNMTPVVDLKNLPNTYLEPDEVGKINMWEYYFEQPTNLSLDEAYSSREFVIGRGVPTWPFFDGNIDNLDYWRDICAKYIKLAPAVIARVQRDKELLFKCKCNGGGGGV